MAAALGVCPGNIHVYTNQGASYSQFYQPRRRRAYERREEVVEENRSQVSESQSTRTPRARIPSWFKVPMLPREGSNREGESGARLTRLP